MWGWQSNPIQRPSGSINQRPRSRSRTTQPTYLMSSTLYSTFPSLPFPSLTRVSLPSLLELPKSKAQKPKGRVKRTRTGTGTGTANTKTSSLDLWFESGFHVCSSGRTHSFFLISCDWLIDWLIDFPLRLKNSDVKIPGLYHSLPPTRSRYQVAPD